MHFCGQFSPLLRPITEVNGANSTNLLPGKESVPTAPSYDVDDSSIPQIRKDTVETFNFLQLCFCRPKI